MADLVAEWLAAHGGPRRYARGESATPDAMRVWLRERGWDLAFKGWKGGGTGTLSRIGARGRPRTVTMRRLIEFVDEMRAAEGLEPIAPVSTKARAA